MKKNTDRSIDEGFMEELAKLENESPAESADSAGSSPKSASGCLRPVGVLLLIVSVFGLLFASPMLEGIPLIATIRIPLEIFGLLDTLSQLPSLLWIVLLLIAVLCLRKKARKPGSASSAPTTSRQSGSKHWSLGSSVENWDSGLKPEVADLAMRRYEEHRRSCPDVFAAAPGIRMMKVMRSRNSQVYEEKVFHWVPDGDHYSILITDPEELRFTLDSHGKVIGVAYGNGTPYPFPMKYHIPYPIARNNKDNDIVVNCYITLLGGL